MGEKDYLYEFRWINDQQHAFMVIGDREATVALIHHFENFICLPFRIIRMADGTRVVPEDFELPRIKFNYWVTGNRVMW